MVSAAVEQALAVAGDNTISIFKHIGAGLVRQFAAEYRSIRHSSKELMNVALCSSGQHPRARFFSSSV